MKTNALFAATVRRLENAGFDIIRTWDNGAVNMLGPAELPDDARVMYPVAPDGTVAGFANLDAILATEDDDDEVVAIIRAADRTRGI